MSPTFKTVSGIIAEICDISKDDITLESHVTEDLGVDSLDFLDAVFNIEQTYGITIPMDEWTQQVNDGEVKGSRYFVLGNFCGEVEKLVAAKPEPATA